MSSVVDIQSLFSVATGVEAEAPSTMASAPYPDDSDDSVLNAEQADALFPSRLHDAQTTMDVRCVS